MGTRLGLGMWGDEGLLLVHTGIKGNGLVCSVDFREGSTT